MIQAPDIAAERCGPDPVDSLGPDDVPRAQQIHDLVLHMGHSPLLGQEHGKHTVAKKVQQFDLNSLTANVPVRMSVYLLVQCSISCQVR